MPRALPLREGGRLPRLQQLRTVAHTGDARGNPTRGVQFDDDGRQESCGRPAGAVACLRQGGGSKEEAAGRAAWGRPSTRRRTRRLTTVVAPLAGLPGIEVAIDARGRPLASARRVDRGSGRRARAGGHAAARRPPLWRDVKSSSYDGCVERVGEACGPGRYVSYTRRQARIPDRVLGIPRPGKLRRSSVRRRPPESCTSFA